MFYTNLCPRLAYKITGIILWWKIMNQSRHSISIEANDDAVHMGPLLTNRNIEDWEENWNERRTHTTWRYLQRNCKIDSSFVFYSCYFFFDIWYLITNMYWIVYQIIYFLLSSSMKFAILIFINRNYFWNVSGFCRILNTYSEIFVFQSCEYRGKLLVSFYTFNYNFYL